MTDPSKAPQTRRSVAPDAPAGESAVTTDETEARAAKTESTAVGNDATAVENGETTDEGETAVESDDDAGTPAAGRRRRIMMIATAVGVLVAVVVGVVLARNSGGFGPFTVVTVTHTVGAPTPATDPVERDTSTALLAALPGTVLDYAVSGQDASETLVKEHFALEGWRLAYTSPDAEITLSVGQWPTTEEAEEAFTALSTVDDAPEPAEQAQVVVGGEEVGTMLLIPLSEDTERTIWRNGTAVFIADGPTGTTQAFYDAYPL